MNEKRNILEIKSTFKNNSTKLPCQEYNCNLCYINGELIKI